MKKLIVVFFCILGFSIAPGWAQTVQKTAVQFEFLLPEDAVESGIRLNTYLFLHSIYFHVFYKFDLIAGISTRDKSLIIGRLQKYLSRDYPVGIVIDNYQDDMYLVVALRVIEANGKRVIILSTNYDQTTKRLVPLDGDMADTYAQLYRLEGDRTINLHSLFDPEREKELLADTENVSIAKNNLADMYIFDEIAENDSQIEPLLREAVRTAKESFDAIFAKLTLSQYFLVINQPKRAAELIRECAESMADMEEQGDDVGLANAGPVMGFAEEEYAIFTALK